MGFLFSDGSDLEGVRQVQDIKYMRILMHCLNILSAWPAKAFGKAEPKFALVRKVYILLLNAVCVPLGVKYLLVNNGVIDFLELGHTYVTVVINIGSFFRTVLIFLKTYNNLVSDFVSKIHLFNHKDRSEYAMMIHIKIHKLSHFFTVYINIMMVIGILLFNATPLYKNFSSGAFRNYKTENVTFELSVYFQIPLDYKHNIKSYAAVFVFNWYMSFVCSSTFCIFDLLMSLMVFHVCGNLQILINKLNTFRRPLMLIKLDNGIEYEWYTEEELKLVTRDLKDIIIHHNIVTEFISRMGETFGLELVLYYTFHIVNGCVLLLECSQLNAEALLRYGTLTFIVFQQCIQISFVFELLGIMSERLKDAAYCVPWECMDTSNRKNVYIILIITQRSLAIKAMNMVEVGVQTMATIIKTSLSYFIMLRTFAGE